MIALVIYKNSYFVMYERNGRVLRGASLKEKLRRSRFQRWIRSTFIYEWFARVVSVPEITLLLPFPEETLPRVRLCKYVLVCAHVHGFKVRQNYRKSTTEFPHSRKSKERGNAT